MTSRTIAVTDENISSCRLNRERDTRHCMISDAVQRTVPGALFVDSDIRFIRFSLESTQRRYFYETPQRAAKALLDFDAGRPVKPFTFVLTRGFSETRRSKQAGFVPAPRRTPVTRRRRSMPPRRREFGLRAYDPGQRP
jgi:hypothetical protein